MRDPYSLAGRLRAQSELLADSRWSDADGGEMEAEVGLAAAAALIRERGGDGGRIFVAGNGGSAALAAHAVTDFVNGNGLAALTLHEPSLLTCMSNDHGYAAAYARILSHLSGPLDLLIAISSSGRSTNLLQAAAVMHNAGGKVLTLTGFDADNPLRIAGDLNVWLDSHDYGLVEVGHGFLLHLFSDRIKAEAAP